MATFSQTTISIAFCDEKLNILIQISQKFIPKGAIDYKSSLVRIMAWSQIDDKLLPKPVLTQFIDAALGGDELDDYGLS